MKKRKFENLPRMDKASVESDIESLFKDVVFLVEATHNEQHNLWVSYFDKSQEIFGHGQLVKTWEQEMAGHTCIIGEFGGMPINLCFFYAKIDGRRVCFWECVSMVSHSDMIARWFEPRTKHIRWDAGVRPGRTNAANFHHCLHAIKDMNKKPTHQWEQRQLGSWSGYTCKNCPKSVLFVSDQDPNEECKGWPHEQKKEKR